MVCANMFGYNIYLCLRGFHLACSPYILAIESKVLQPLIIFFDFEKVPCVCIILPHHRVYQVRNEFMYILQSHAILFKWEFIIFKLNCLVGLSLINYRNRN